MKKHGNITKSAAAHNALISGVSKSAAADSCEMARTFRLNEPQMQKLKSLMNSLGLGRKTILNMSIRYGIPLAISENPGDPTKVKSFPKREGKEVLDSELTAQTLSILKGYELEQEYNKFAVFGINKLYLNLKIEKLDNHI